MKRLILPLFLALTLALSGCAPSAGGDTLPPSETARTSPSGAAQTPPDTPAPSPAQETADYTVERQDRSILNSDGTTALSWYCDLVRLTGDTPEIQTINDSLSAHCDEFFAKDVGDVPLDKDHEMVWRNTAEATVTENENGLFSVRMDTDWYMGGVYNSNSLGYTYDLATGEELGLADLTGQDPETLAATLRQLVKAYMATMPEAGWWEDAADIVDSRSLEDMIFWVEGGKIVLCFSTYDLAIGAHGPDIIPTGIIAEHGID